MHAKNMKHVNVKSAPPLLFSSFFFFFFSSPYQDVSGINHRGDDENQPSAAPQDCRGPRDSCCMLSRTAVSKLCLTARAVPPAALRLPPTERRFPRLIYDADIMNAQPQPLCVYEKNMTFFCRPQKYCLQSGLFNGPLVFNEPKSCGGKIDAVKWQWSICES